MSRLLSRGLSGDQSQPSNAAPLWKWAAWASGAAVATYLLVPGSRPNRGLDETGFDAFLVQQGPVPTGTTAPSKGKHSLAAAVAAGGGPFECFLKAQDDEEEDVRNPLDFNSFLLTAKAGQGTKGAAAAPAQQQAAPAVEERPSPDMARVLVLFGTEYGFSKEIAELLASKLKETKAFWCDVQQQQAHMRWFLASSLLQIGLDWQQSEQSCRCFALMAWVETAFCAPLVQAHGGGHGVAPLRHGSEQRAGCAGGLLHTGTQPLNDWKADWVVHSRGLSSAQTVLIVLKWPLAHLCCAG